jgi:hypothetical protein
VCVTYDAGVCHVTHAAGADQVPEAPRRSLPQPPFNYIKTN